MKKIFEKNQAITLVSLVVTIIILIILAGVSVNMLLGQNGIITKAKEASKMQEIASIKEEIKLKILEQEIEGQVTQEKIETILSNYGTVNKNEDGTINSLTPTGKDYEIAYEEIYIYVTSEGENTSGSTGDGTNSGTETGSSSDTVTLTREEYNAIIERLDALDGGSKTSVSIADITSNITTIQNNINSNINDINNDISDINDTLTQIHAVNPTSQYIGDLNNLTNVFQVYTNVCDNTPNDQWGLAFTYYHENTTVAFQAAFTVGKHLYLRTKNASTTWSDWVQVQ